MPPDFGFRMLDLWFTTLQNIEKVIFENINLMWKGGYLLFLVSGISTPHIIISLQSLKSENPHHIRD